MSSWAQKVSLVYGHFPIPMDKATEMIEMIEDIGHFGLIDQSFFRAPITAGSLVPDYSILGPTGYNPSDNPSHISNVRRTAQILASTNNIGHPTIFTPHNYLAPTTSNYKAPDISDNASHISNVHHTAQTRASTNGLWGPTISTSPDAPSPHGPSDISSPVPSAAQIGQDNIAQPSYTSRRVPELNVPSIDDPSGSLAPCSLVPELNFLSIDGPSGSLIPCSHVPEPSFPSSIDPSGTCDPSQLVIDMTKFKSPDPLGSLDPCSLVPDTTRPNGPEPADISNNKDITIDPIDQFTNINDEDPYMEFCDGGNNTGQSVEEDALEVLQPRRKCQRRNKLEPESVNNSHASDASEPYAGEDNPPQPGRDTGLPFEDANLTAGTSASIQAANHLKKRVLQVFPNGTKWRGILRNMKLRNISARCLIHMIDSVSSAGRMGLGDFHVLPARRIINISRAT
ncbi:MAG: hypothetical protein Q9161_009440 [Pseudevernia consocians]